jgi:hypothetical protein
MSTEMFEEQAIENLSDDALVSLAKGAILNAKPEFSEYHLSEPRIQRQAENLVPPETTSLNIVFSALHRQSAEFKKVAVSIYKGQMAITATGPLQG